MDVERLFSLAGSVAVVGWAALLASTLLNLPMLRRIVSGLIVPVGLAVAYTALLVMGFPAAEGDFSSLQGVSRLFQSPVLLLAGWIHYLAFDLLVGVHIAEQNESVGIPRLLMVPIFAATFLVGPAGFLAFQAFRVVLGRHPLALAGVR